MIDTQTLELFTRQIAHWAEAAISEGRFPFRKIETFPRIQSAGGELIPPLVLWVNRESCMAGGVFFFPQREADEALQQGRHCARALGLRHFITWAPREVVIWEDASDGARRHKTYVLPQDCNQAAAQLHGVLVQILDELKLLSVLGSIPPAELSAHYLANLCLGTLQATLPLIDEAFRIARGENRLAKDSPSAEALAYHKGALSLVRLLALVFHDRLPPAVQPEGLERAMQFAIDTLPDHLRAPLRSGEEELSLPAEAAVRFHHLFRRLTQVRPGEDIQRACQALEIVLAATSPHLGGHPLPGCPPETGVVLLLAPDRLYQQAAATAEWGSLPLLAATALLRDLCGAPPALAQTADLFSLPVAIEPTAVLGTLGNERPLFAAQRQRQTARLRSSWPTRRFLLPAQTPLWVWELLHLLGLAASEAVIEIRIPGDWLRADYGLILYDLFREQFTLEAVAWEEPQWSQLRLRKGLFPHSITQLTGPEENRALPWSQLCRHRAQMVFAMYLSEELHALFAQDQLRLADEENWPEEREREVFLFSRSSLGRQLWQLLSGGASLPGRSGLRESCQRLGFALPAEEILEGLARLPWQGPDQPPSLAAIDAELHAWLGKGLELAAPAPHPVRRRTATSGAQDAGHREALEEQLIAAAQAEGVPRFPEQYLYDYFRPALQDYPVPGPLSAEEEFFGRFTLCDKTGACLEVEGAETARALVLASFGGCPVVALPTDRSILATIVDRYLSDLQALRTGLLRQAHARAADPKTADSLTERVWKRLQLPPWVLVKSFTSS